MTFFHKHGHNFIFFEFFSFFIPAKHLFPFKTVILRKHLKPEFLVIFYSEFK